MRLAVVIMLSASVALCGCSKAEETKSSAGDKFREATSELEQQAQAADKLRREATDNLGRQYDKAKDYVKGGSDDALEAIAPYVDKTTSTVETLLVEGKQGAEKVAEISKSLASSVGDGVGIKPIYELIEGGASGDAAAARAAVDKAIGSMPRLDVIDGLTVGFRAHGKRQYLVVWRSGDHMVGFVYTSLTDIVIEALLKRLPQLIALVRVIT